MEKERKTRVIAIIALCIAVVGLSIGFAAFTRDLNIQFSDSNVNISGDLDVQILASYDLDDTSTTIYPTHSEIIDDIGYATISSDRTTISGIRATFTDKGQIVQYDFYIYNASEYDAYLKSVDFLNYLGADTNKVCTALEGTNQEMVDEACEDIHVILASDLDNDNGFSANEMMIDIGESNISSIRLPKGKRVFMTLAINYAGDHENEELYDKTGSALLPNGDFKVNFGDIKMNFSSLEG